MNLRQLHAFRAAMREGSVTHAAEALGVTQPAASSLITKLEDDLGFLLFKRDKGRIVPTPEGRHFYQEVEKILSAVDKATRAAHDIRDLRLGQLRIAAMPGLSLVFLPRVVARFLARRPEVSATLQTRSSIQVKEWIAAQLYDIGIAELPVDDPAIEAKPLSMDCVCALPEGHPLAAHEVITPALIARTPVIALGRDHMTHFRLFQAFEEAGVAWQPKIECQLFAPACNLVAEGLGVAVIDPVTAADHRSHGIVTRPFEPRIPFDVAILYPANQPRSQLVQSFARDLEAAIAPYLRDP